MWVQVGALKMLFTLPYTNDNFSDSSNLPCGLQDVCLSFVTKNCDTVVVMHTKLATRRAI